MTNDWPTKRLGFIFYDFLVNNLWYSDMYQKHKHKICKSAIDKIIVHRKKISI